MVQECPELELSLAHERAEWPWQMHELTRRVNSALFCPYASFVAATWAESLPLAEEIGYLHE